MQTPATKEAILRDRGLCMWHLHKLDRVVGMFDFRPNYHSAYAGGHHVFRRNRVDTAETIITLCAECHYNVEHANIKKVEMVALLSRITGVDLYHKYPEFCRWDEATWQSNSDETGQASALGYSAEPQN